MMGTMHGIPADHAKQNTGFNDPRLDTDDTIPYRILATGETVDGGGEFDLEGFPYEPYKIELKPGEEASITNYTTEQRQEEKGKSLYPRWTNKPTTSVYARGMSDSSSNVQINSIVSYKKKLLGSSKATIKSKFTASQTLINNSAKIKTPAAPYNAFINPLIYEVDETEKIDFPDTAYNAIYPFNHVYESESGHLIEIDDTPEAERLHWYHRAGTFTEFTFGGSRVENTQGHNFHSITGNLEEIISGKEKRSISNDSFSTYSKNKFQDIGNDYVLTTKGDLLLGSSGGFLSIKGNNVVIDASQTLYMEATNIIRSQKSSKDVFRGSYTQEIFGGLNSKAETFSLNASIGSGQVITAGNMTHGVGGVSEETIGNIKVALNPNAKTIRATLGKILLESLEPVSGGIDLNVGPFGVAGQVSIGKLGIIDITSKLGINISAIKETTLEGMVKAAVKGVLIDIIAQGIVKIEGAAIQLNGTSEPALKGKAFLDVFEKHQHTSSVGPTGGILPAYGMKAMKTMSQKVFLG